MTFVCYALPGAILITVEALKFNSDAKQYKREIANLYSIQCNLMLKRDVMNRTYLDT